MSDDPSNQTDKIQSRNLLPRTTTSQILMSKKLTGDQIRDAIAVFTSGGSVKLPLIPRPKMKMKVCMLGDAQHVEKMDGDTVDLEVDKLPDIDDDHSIEDGDVIINFRDVMELDKELSSLVWGRCDKPENDDRCSEYNFLDVMELDKELSSFVWGFFDKPENDDRFSGRDPEYEDIDRSNFQLFKDYIFKKRDEDESGREENVGNDDKIEEDTKRQFGTAFVASKDVFGQQKKQKLL